MWIVSFDNVISVGGATQNIRSSVQYIGNGVCGVNGGYAMAYDDKLSINIYNN